MVPVYVFDCVYCKNVRKDDKYTRVQSIALDLNTNFTKTAVFCEVRRRSEPNLIILPPLLERYFYTQKQKGGH